MNHEVLFKNSALFWRYTGQNKKFCLCVVTHLKTKIAFLFGHKSVQCDSRSSRNTDAAGWNFNSRWGNELRRFRVDAVGLFQRLSLRIIFELYECRREKTTSRICK